MLRYVKYYKDVLSPTVCNKMIDLFEAHPEQQEEIISPVMDFKQINLMQHTDIWAKYNEILFKTFEKALAQYKRECKIQDIVQWPTEYGYEQYRMKKYEPGKGKFDLHTDATDLTSAKRFLVFFLYLNTGDDGGTRFPDLKVTTPRVRGSLLMFPPLWTYPHAGLMPMKGPKYIVGSYLHYLEK